MSSSDITFRHLSTEPEYAACVALQRETWGAEFHDVVPPAMLAISQKVSGIVAGAFRGEHMLGFVYGLAGIRHGRSAHWSHMLAVTPEARGLGLGRKLKLFQREYLLGIGVEVVYWSYDPLVARNANLNFNRLGARPTEYVRDMYGSDTGSELHSALGTDRFVVAWEIASPEVAATIEGRAREAPLPAAPELLVNSHWETGEVLRGSKETGLPGADEGDEGAAQFWVEVPKDIEEVKGRDREEAMAWRESSRAALAGGLERGFAVDDFSMGDPVGGAALRCFYVLRRSG